MTTNFSVLISVYSKENPIFLKEALNSTVNQSLLPSEIVLVKDGPLTKELDKVINEFNQTFRNLKIIVSEKNVGLGRALNIGLKKCSFDLIARMDSDDVCEYDRFLQQINFMNENPDIDIVGGYIQEFFNVKGDSKLMRKVPLSSDDIINRFKRRNAMNHVTVLFRKQSILEVDGYQPLLYLEDYYLWLRMMLVNKKFANLDKVLVFVRTGSGMYKRRGDKSYTQGWKKIQLILYKNGFISYLGFKISMLQIRIFLLVPTKIRYLMYKFLLRQKAGIENER